MSPETWAGIGQALAGALLVLGGQRGVEFVQARRRKNGNGQYHERSGDARLAKVEHELLDSDGMVRSRFHSLANSIQVAIGKTELQEQRVKSIEDLGRKLDGRLETISGQLGDLRVDVGALAARGGHCDHCPGN